MILEWRVKKQHEFEFHGILKKNIIQVVISRISFKKNIQALAGTLFSPSLKQRSISVLGWWTGVTAKLPQFKEEGDEHRLSDGVGVASSSRIFNLTEFLFFLFPFPSISASSLSLSSSVEISSWQVKSSAEAHGALKPKKTKYELISRKI